MKAKILTTLGLCLAAGITAIQTRDLGSILLIGDSITQGQVICDASRTKLVIESPWRIYFRDILSANGIKPKFIGIKLASSQIVNQGRCMRYKEVINGIPVCPDNIRYQTIKNPDDMQHGAFCGMQTNELLAHEKADIARLKSENPSTIVLAAGFNDLWGSAGNLEPSGALARTKALIDYQVSNFKTAKIFIATIIENQDIVQAPKIKSYNNLLKQEVQNRIKNGQNVVLLDFNSKSAASDTWDTIHPTNSQAARLGVFAYHAITGTKTSWTPND